MLSLTTMLVIGYRDSATHVHCSVLESTRSEEVERSYLECDRDLRRWLNEIFVLTEAVAYACNGKSSEENIEQPSDSTGPVVQTEALDHPHANVDTKGECGGGDGDEDAEGRDEPRTRAGHGVMC